MSDSTAPRRATTLHRLREMHRAGEKIAMLTCYDATFAGVLDDAGVDCLLVGDSLGMVLQGRETTLPVTVADIAYHVACVARGNRHAWLLADLPHGSYHASPQQALHTACELTRAGAHMVKLEGGATWAVETVRFLVERDIPVCAHLGLTPQSVHALGGWRVQGRQAAQAQALLAQAKALRDAGAAMLVLELVPSALAAEVAQALDIPVIGIGAGAGCGGQVLVLHDMLGLNAGSAPRFVRNFMEGSTSIPEAVQAYVRAVKAGRFPEEGVHTY
ncbi:3-methyl-2-oxobutanoate hydroxymethyltransferase [Ramlibacter sp. AW1]|uniref:3-methyl-2-oxobutanoate hydroxymethyltransferase n=1 Tax=Ramlibacter aurantiacus TaxID=2801330 RepID=A0A936ZK69_9BURK|nr:3-methyl-2-oxobutanoate hydroxymethyltransferase [Ramlibacter aurantiacus]MBL0421307.1 3-methyl-2-oxobutanoate hydroxymethyltransferase [Ramlibacter aurantiacus]